MGSDDGRLFWSVQGRLTELAAGDHAGDGASTLEIDLAPVGGRALVGRLATGKL